jgi:hypothetical protein
LWELPLRETFLARSLVVSNTADPSEEHINEHVVIAKQQEQKTPLYDPPNATSSPLSVCARQPRSNH